jgi:hypothetical protein
MANATVASDVVNMRFMTFFPVLRVMSGSSEPDVTATGRESEEFRVVVLFSGEAPGTTAVNLAGAARLSTAQSRGILALKGWFG